VKSPKARQGSVQNGPLLDPPYSQPLCQDQTLEATTRAQQDQNNTYGPASSVLGAHNFPYMFSGQDSTGVKSLRGISSSSLAAADHVGAFEQVSSTFLFGLPVHDVRSWRHRNPYHKESWSSAFLRAVTSPWPSPRNRLPRTLSAGHTKLCSNFSGLADQSRGLCQALTSTPNTLE
jgi:hypothetical protein